MHFRSLCVSDTHSPEPARAEVDIDSRETKRAKAEYRETQKWSRLQWWRRQDETMSRAIEKSRESGTRQRMCERMPKNLYLLRIHILWSAREDFDMLEDAFLGRVSPYGIYNRFKFINRDSCYSWIALQFKLINNIFNRVDLLTSFGRMLRTCVFHKKEMCHCVSSQRV